MTAQKAGSNFIVTAMLANKGVLTAQNFKVTCQKNVRIGKMLKVVKLFS